MQANHYSLFVFLVLCLGCRTDPILHFNSQHSGGIQLGQGTAVPEVVDSSPVKAFSVPVEARWEKEFLEDVVL